MKYAVHLRLALFALLAWSPLFSEVAAELNLLTPLRVLPCGGELDSVPSVVTAVAFAPDSEVVAAAGDERQLALLQFLAKLSDKVFYRVFDDDILQGKAIMRSFQQ